VFVGDGVDVYVLVMVGVKVFVVEAVGVWVSVPVGVSGCDVAVVVRLGEMVRVARTPICCRVGVRVVLIISWVPLIRRNPNSARSASNPSQKVSGDRFCGRGVGLNC
jgi:hypothetical protein